MKIKTHIALFGEWQIEVRSDISIYPSNGKYYTHCSLKNNRGETICLVRKYSIDEKIAALFHQDLCQKAKGLFDL